MSLRQMIEAALNAASAENASNTPDFILAEYLLDCLAAFNKASIRRETWYGHYHEPGGVVKLVADGGVVKP